MMKNTMMRWLTMLLLLTVVLTVTASVDAVTFTTTAGCKNWLGEGIEYQTGDISITNPTAEKFRGQIQVQIMTPTPTTTLWETHGTPATETVQAVYLYAASDGKQYQCQQLETDGKNNTFSCNSFPSGAVIKSVHVRFIPQYSGTAPDYVLNYGDYTIKIVERDTPANELLSGTAKVDAAATACAQNQGTGTFSPESGKNAFIYSTGTCATPVFPGAQPIKFVENTTSPFTIVSFPLNEKIDPKQFKLISSYGTTLFDYEVEFEFQDSNATPQTFTIKYEFKNGAKEGVRISVTPNDTDWTTSFIYPLKLTGGTITIDPIDTLAAAALPTQADFSFQFYYQNFDPNLGYENSMFHFTRRMSVQFANQCDTISETVAYAVSSVAYDYCKSTGQSFSLPFIKSTGEGIIISGANTEITPEDRTDGSRPDAKNVYFMTRRCSDASCNTYADSEGAYVSSVTVSDGWATETTYGTAGTSLNTLSRIPMHVFENSSTLHEFTLRRITLVATKPGTYVISAFKGAENGTMYGASDGKLLLYITIPQVDSENACYTPGNAGRFDAAWNGCNEDFDTEVIEFKAQNEKYAFISNYSNKTLTFPLDAAVSSMPTAIEMSELYCEWQVLAEGYSTSGGECNPKYVTVPPYARAIVTGGKFVLRQKPKVGDGDEYTIVYRRSDTGNQMQLIFDLVIKECPQEKIPETGYSLRSPQTMSTAEQSGSFIFTGNSLQIPAIGLGMETPIPIVHVGYVGDTYESGWNLKMVGGYIGELEGGAYLPFAGNSVLTGHYYSQGVFVNLTGLHLEDEVIVYGNDGMKYIYKVTNSYYTKPTDVLQLFQPNGERSLTLVTCDDYNFITDDYNKRFIVQATLELSEPYQ